MQSFENPNISFLYCLYKKVVKHRFCQNQENLKQNKKGFQKTF